MKTDLLTSRENRIDLLLEVIREKKRLFIDSSKNENGKKTYNFNSHVVISESIDFLEAIRKEVGGEIINSKTIGAFLYLG
jgi:hypothetical protein